jgi:pilus assembly protein CpaF
MPSFISFIGAKGGTGVSTICAELAKVMRNDQNVTLVDADLGGRRSIAILLDAVRQLDAVRDVTDSHVACVRMDGVSIAEIVDSYESSFTLSFDEVEKFAAELEGGTVLVDVPLPFSANVRPFFARSSRFIVVAEASLLGLAAARTTVAQMRRFGVPATRMGLVIVSRSATSNGHRAEAERAVGISVIADLPAAEDRNFARAMQALARDIRGTRPEPPLDALAPSDNGQARDRRIATRPVRQSSQLATLHANGRTNSASSSFDRGPRDMLKAEIHEALAKHVDLVDASKAQGDAAKMNELRAKIREISEELLIAKGLQDGAEEIARLKEEIINEALGLGPLEDLMHDNDITEIMVNGPDEIYIERFGIIHRTPKRFANVRQLMLVIERIIAPLGRRLDEACPMVDARLPDGSRVNAIIEPLSLNGPTLTIRRFGINRLTSDDLINKGSVNEPILEFLRAAVEARLNICISGGTGSGKTTFLNILSDYLPKAERIVTIEDAAELCLSQPHVVRLESRPPNIEGTGQVTIRDLVRNSLRMRPDRIVVGECRGAETLDMLQAMNTGHDGSLTTIHANSTRDCLARIETMVLMAGFDLPVKAIREQVSSAVNVVVQLARMRDGSRKLVALSEIVGMEGDVVTMQDLVKFASRGVDERNRVIGEFQYTGVQPQALRRFQEYGVDYDARSLTYLEPAVNLW